MLVVAYAVYIGSEVQRTTFGYLPDRHDEMDKAVGDLWITGGFYGDEISPISGGSWRTHI